METTTGPLRILVADDHALLRAGITSVLAGAGFVVCGEAPTPTTTSSARCAPALAATSSRTPASTSSPRRSATSLPAARESRRRSPPSSPTA